jgi:transcriptional regulator with XRE-family HTH domain
MLKVSMITMIEIGRRLKDLRVKANQSQEFVAAQLNTSQNIISRMEKGDGASLQMFLNVITYYRSIYNMDNFLAADFDVSDVEPSHMTGLESLAIEKLNMLKDEMTSEIEKVIALIQKN